MLELKRLIRRVARSDRPVLVIGPTGAGKELVVRSIHRCSSRREEPLLDINCGAIPEALIESQLFGHERGAFTGAERRRDGYLGAVENGTLFLDEIAELPLLLQARLLRVLESKEYRLIGSNTKRSFDGRIVAATHAELDERVKNRTFREDLFYRLNVLVVHVPPLCERLTDIPKLVAHFARQQTRPLRFSDEAMAALSNATWPGNVRQLRNVIDRIAVLSDDERVTRCTIRQFMAIRRKTSVATLQDYATSILRLDVNDKLTAIQDALVKEAIRESGGNKSAAARLLGVHRKVIERRSSTWMTRRPHNHARSSTES